MMGPDVTPVDGNQHRYLLNMGPQHPSTHGVLRVLLEMDGEYVLNPQPVLGYAHRMQEKIAETRPWSAYTSYTSRMDYAGAIAFNHGYVLLIEKMAGIEVPLRAEYIRVIMVEMNRIASHLLWLGAFLLDLGAFTPILYCFDDREYSQDILEDITGARLTYCYFRAGGVCRDIDEKFGEGVRAFIRRMRERFHIYDDLVTDNIILRRRLEGVGIVTADMARRYGITGPVLRGSGIPYDIRKCEPYSLYSGFDFDIPVGVNGDCFDRYRVRVQEMEQSLRIIEQALSALPEGPFLGQVPKKVKLPAGDCTCTVEAARGALSYYLVGDGSDVPYRLKIRPPSYSNLSALPELCEGMLLADLVAVMGSMDLVIPEIDR